ncbi:MAG: hypothetical protein JNL70_24995 [Saprospiraceae bacterium]|nr:hypothetical protein [Saprospiraceae bacterium]
MKPYLTQAIFLSFALIVMSCKEKVKEIPTPNEPKLAFGSISGIQLNGKSMPKEGMVLSIWSDYFNVCGQATFNIALKHETAPPFTNFQEYYFFSSLPVNQLGKIKLSPQSYSTDTCHIVPYCDFYMMQGNDVLIATYNLLKNSDSYVLIDSINKNEVIGTIEATLIATGTSATSKAVLPDTLRLSNAKFKVPSIR